jgi:hypothetical protein
VRVATGRAPNKANVLTGPYASLWSFGSAWAPCFGLPNVTNDVLRAAVGALQPPGGGQVTGTNYVLSSDIILPTLGSRALDSRLVPTHEYGHYALCSMLWQEGRIDAIQALSRLTINYITGGTKAPDNVERILFESFADFFVAQVGGGVNYIVPPGARQIAAGAICRPTDGAGNPTDGLEGNFSRDCAATDTPEQCFYQRIRWALSLMHDAFDGHDHPTPVPGDADLWEDGPAGHLVHSTSRFGDSCGKTGIGAGRNENLCDERVALGGDRMRAWVNAWQARGHTLSYDNFFGGLADAAAGAGVDWCRRCELFASHSAGFEGLPRYSTPMARRPARDYWDRCTEPDQDISRWLGPAPEPSLNLDAATCQPCPAGHVSPAGQCLACGPNEVVRNNACEACIPGSTAIAGTNQCACGPWQRQADDGINCIHCGPNEIATDPRTCTACNAGSMRVANENRCACPVHHINPPGGNGLCTYCGDNQIVIAPGVCGSCGSSMRVANENRCECAPRTRPLGNGLCAGCGGNEIFDGTACVACPAGRVPAPNENRCVDEVGCGFNPCGGGDVPLFRDGNCIPNSFGECTCVTRLQCTSDPGREYVEETEQCFARCLAL